MIAKFKYVDYKNNINFCTITFVLKVYTLVFNDSTWFGIS